MYSIKQKLSNVNSHHVKKSKELDDNNPNKNDRKDPKTIAGLINEGRYTYPYIPEGVYAEIRTASNLRFQTQAELTRVQNRPDGLTFTFLNIKMYIRIHTGL